MIQRAEENISTTKNCILIEIRGKKPAFTTYKLSTVNRNYRKRKSSLKVKIQ